MVENETMARQNEAAEQSQPTGWTIEQAAALRYLYALGQLLLGNEPTAARLESVDVALLPDALEIIGLDDDRGVVEAIGAAKADVDGACALYTKLFIGPGQLAATPWESTYLTKSKTLFCQETLEVRNAYRVQGFLPQAYPKVADDHIALELGFLTLLAGRAVDALQADDAAIAEEAQKASDDFVANHLLRWIDDYAADLAKAADGSLYDRLVRLMAAVAHQETDK